jgi:hypothetical protein
VKDWIGVQNIFASVNIGAGVAQSVKWFWWKLKARVSLHGRDFSVRRHVEIGSLTHARSALCKAWEKLFFARTWQELQAGLSLPCSLNIGRGSPNPKIFITSWSSKPRLFSGT